MGLYDEFRQLADDLMADFAVPAVLTRTTRTIDRTTDAVTDDTTALSCLAILTPREVKASNGRIVVGTMAKLNVKPSIGDKLKVGATTYTVETVEEVAPDGNAPIIYMAQVTK